MRSNHSMSLAFFAVVFVMLTASGTLLSRQKLLWNDELFTQRAVIDGCSYGDILVSRTPDGNRNPLFYLLQKGTSDMFRYHLPAAYAHTIDVARVRDIRSQVIMRLPSNVYMSLALAMIFYFFSRFYSVLAGVYALLAAFSLPMVWLYWVEARPYSLWFLLTTIQLLLLACLVTAPKIKIFKPLLVTHLLLALTITASIFQISIALVMMWWKGRFSKKEMFIAWAPAMAVALAYIVLVPVFKTKTYFFLTNFFDAVMPERLVFYALYAAAAWLVPKQRLKQGNHVFFLAIYVLLLASALLLLTVDLFTQHAQFGFFSRYLIFVVPADILMFAFAGIDLRRWARPYPWATVNVCIVLAGLVLVRGLLTYRTILASATYLHSPW